MTPTHESARERCGYRPSAAYVEERIEGNYDGAQGVDAPSVHAIVRFDQSCGVVTIRHEDGLFVCDCPICGRVTGPNANGCDPAKHAAYYDAFPRGAER